MEGNFVQPTIVKAKNHWDIVQEETFAPILYIIKYKTLDEAIAYHNDVPQGLSSSMFTLNIQNGTPHTILFAQGHSLVCIGMVYYN